MIVTRNARGLMHQDVVLGSRAARLRRECVLEDGTRPNRSGPWGGRLAHPECRGTRGRSRADVGGAPAGLRPGPGRAPSRSSSHKFVSALVCSCICELQGPTSKRRASRVCSSVSARLPRAAALRNYRPCVLMSLWSSGLLAEREKDRLTVLDGHTRTGRFRFTACRRYRSCRPLYRFNEIFTPTERLISGWPTRGTASTTVVRSDRRDDVFVKVSDIR